MTSSLQKQLSPIRRRWWALGLAAGLIGAIVATILFLIVGGWLDLVWELSPQGRIGILATAALLGTTIFVAVIVSVAKKGRTPLLARRVDQTMGFGGALLTGCELEDAIVRRRRYPTEMSTSLAGMAVEHAASLAGTAVPKQVVSDRTLRKSAICLAVVSGFVGLLALVMPEMIQTQWSRFLFPYSDVPRYSKTTIEIEDPDKRVVFGDPLGIRATVRGEPVDSAVLVLENASGTVETLPMFSESDSCWRTNLAKVTENAVYYVRADRARSTRHPIEVITVPRFEKVRFRVTPPSYTRRPAYDGPLPKDGLSGLPGTKVEILASSNRPLSRGSIYVSINGVNSVGDNHGSPIAMDPKTPADTEVGGEFEITGNGKFELQLVDVDGQESRDKFVGSITLLKDQRPMVRIVKPPARSLATPSVSLPVSIYAEDDYGISKLELFRSLNESRFLPGMISLHGKTPDEPVRRFHGEIDLPLFSYGLQPGDAVKIFARVEDNDPAGAKGSESAVVLVEIISQRQFEQMLLQKNAMEIMLSRYREALRRLETMNDELQRLKEKLDRQNPDDPASAETRRELRELAERMKFEAEKIRKLAENPLPYDLDKQLAEELAKAAELPEDAAEAIEKMLAGEKPDNKTVKKMLDELGKKMGAGKKSFDESTMPSLELLAAVMPLKVDENRFVALVIRQKDLAERLSSLKDNDRADDSSIKARMRELEDEQREIRESLASLLADIEKHVQALPEREEFEALRTDAGKFVDDVRKSGADKAMGEAQSGLAEYSGKIGHAKAQEAAEILERFLKQCEGMGECACKALRFSPGMGNCLNQTMEQMLRDMGFGMNGSGAGMMGSGYGMGAQRGGPNVGLYGMLPGMTSMYDPRGSGQGGNSTARGKGGDGEAMSFDDMSGYEMSAEGTVGGTGEGAVPLRYRQAVGRYFQRIVEEDE